VAPLVRRQGPAVRALPDRAADEVTAPTRQLPAALVRAGLRDALGR
jgi:hypothetical protein